jgi:hypothetical protein
MHGLNACVRGAQRGALAHTWGGARAACSSSGQRTGKERSMRWPACSSVPHARTLQEAPEPSAAFAAGSSTNGGVATRGTPWGPGFAKHSDGTSTGRGSDGCNLEKSPEKAQNMMAVLGRVAAAEVPDSGLVEVSTRRPRMRGEGSYCAASTVWYSRSFRYRSSGLTPDGCTYTCSHVARVSAAREFSAVNSDAQGRRAVNCQRRDNGGPHHCGNLTPWEQAHLHHLAG